MFLVSSGIVVYLLDNCFIIFLFCINLCDYIVLQVCKIFLNIVEIEYFDGQDYDKISDIYFKVYKFVKKVQYYLLEVSRFICIVSKGIFYIQME